VNPPPSGVVASIRTRTGAELGHVIRSVMPPAPPVDVGDTSGIVGHWFVDRDRERWELVISRDADRLSGTMSREGAVRLAKPIQQPTWDAATGSLRFKAVQEDRTLWYAIDVTDGVMTGRYADGTADGQPPTSWSAYSGHLMGWRSESFDQDLVPRVFDIHTADGRYARIRIDRGPPSAPELFGELKTQASDALGAAGELPTLPILVRRWDGKHIAFDLVNGKAQQRFTGDVNGRMIEGTIADDQTGEVSRFAGTRANVLSYGLRVKTSESRTEWQERVRHMLSRLLMAGNPAPIATQSAVAERPLLRSDQLFPGRDDNSAKWQQDYRLSDVVLDHTLPNPYGAEALTRRSHGLLAIPTAPPPPDGYTIVLSLNGHAGSAQGQFRPDNFYWYGDAHARRGYVVLALDISHRLPSDTLGLYNDPLDGDDPENGNHAHPAIAAPDMDSDWTDDGERAWDAMRGIDFLLTLQNVNRAKIVVTGLSMGGAVTEIVSALDPRVTIAIPAGAPPDLSVMAHIGVHPCWMWTHGDPREFVDTSDYVALMAPRPVILESGKWDWLYSNYSLPYAVQKEHAWRSRIAYGDDSAHFIHYLHSGGHEYRVGDVGTDSPEPAYIQVPRVTAPPASPKRTIDWAIKGETVSLGQTLFDYIGR
jgi:dienelactone hydrolase